MVDLDDALKTAYQEVGSSCRAIEDFRAKLLGLLPLASGAGIFLLVNGSSNDLARKAFLLAPVGLFGCAITLGLSVLEGRLQIRNGSLIHAGKQIESLMGIPGPFTLRAPSDFLGNSLAASIIYSAVLSAWIFLVVFSLWPGSWWPVGPVVIATLIFFGCVWLGKSLYPSLRKKILQARQEHESQEEETNTSSIIAQMLEVMRIHLELSSEIRQDVRRLRARFVASSEDPSVLTERDWSELSQFINTLLQKDKHSESRENPGS